MTQVADQRCVITGGARGMGRLLAERILERGGRVALLDRDEKALEAAAGELGPRGVLGSYAVDLTDAAATYATANKVLADFGGVDILINNAGVVTGGALTEVSDECHTRTYMVNTVAVMRMTRALLPAMIANRRGHIVNMASAAGLTGVALQTTYSSSKWAVVGFSEALRQEMQHLHHPIKVTCICPGFVDTGMFAGVRPPTLMPMLQEAGVVDRIMRAIEREERMVMMPFIVRTVPWMRAFLPGRLTDFVSAKLRVNRSMETWRGRGDP